MVKDHRVGTEQLDRINIERGNGCSQLGDESLNNSQFPVSRLGHDGKERRGDYPQLRGMWSTDEKSEPATKSCHEGEVRKEGGLQERVASCSGQRSDNNSLRHAEDEQDVWSQLNGMLSDDSDLMSASKSLRSGEEEEEAWSQLKGVWTDDSSQRVKSNRGAVGRKEDCSQIRGEWPASRFQGVVSKAGQYIEDDEDGWSQLKGVWSDDSSQRSKSSRGGIDRGDCSQIRGEWPASRFKEAIAKPGQHIRDEEDGWSQLKGVWSDDSSQRAKSNRGVVCKKEDCSQIRGEWPASRFQGALSKPGQNAEEVHNGAPFKGVGSESSLGVGTKGARPGEIDRKDCSQIRGEWPASRFQMSETNPGKHIARDEKDCSQIRGEWPASRFQMSETYPGKYVVSERKEEDSQWGAEKDLSDSVGALLRTPFKG